MRDSESLNLGAGCGASVGFAWLLGGMGDMMSTVDAAEDVSASVVLRLRRCCLFSCILSRL